MAVIATGVFGMTGPVIGVTEPPAGLVGVYVIVNVKTFSNSAVTETLSVNVIVVTLFVGSPKVALSDGVAVHCFNL